MHKNDHIKQFDSTLTSLRTHYLDLISRSSEFEVLDLQHLPQVAKERRKALSLSQAQLAELSGLALRTVIKFEKGDQGISLKNVLGLCDALGIKLCLKS